MMTVSVIFYWIVIEGKTKDRVIGLGILLTVMPLILNYLLLLYAPGFVLPVPGMKWLVILFFACIPLISLLLLFTPDYLMRKHTMIKKGVYSGLGILYSVVAIVAIIIVIGYRNHLSFSTSGLPDFIESIYLYVYDFILFYALLIIAFRYIYKQRKLLKYRFILVDYVIVMLLLFLNPFTYPIVATVLTSFKTYHRVFFIMPFAFIIVIYLVNITNMKKLISILLLMALPGITIFHDSPWVFQNDTNFYYKTSEGLVELGNEINSRDDQIRLIGEKKVIGDLPFITNNIVLEFTPYNMRHHKKYENEDLLYVYYVLSDKEEVEFDATRFKQIIEAYEFDVIVVDRSNPLVNELDKLYNTDQTLSNAYYVVFSAK